MLRRDADRNLLFGINALQNDFITRDDLIAAMNAWALEKHRPLGDILVERNALNPDDRDLLNQLIDRHLARHGGDPAASLAAMSSVGSIANELRNKVADPDVLESMAYIPTGSQNDPHATRAPETADYIPAGVRYHKVRDHARGGLGIVFLARDNELNREVALKEIKPEYADNLGSQARFLIEAEITGGLEHPGIVPVYGLGHYDDGRPYYAMRFIRGDSLKDAINTFHSDKGLKDDPGAQALALQKLLRRFLDVCNAVAYAHSRGVLHRDLKPDNVMVGRYGETLVVDWGLAKSVGRSGEDGYGPLPESTVLYATRSNSAETIPGSIVGTPGYMSPEQAAGRLDLLGPTSDIYSLGGTLYTLLTGRVPVSGKDVGEILRRVERGEFPRPRESSPWLDPALEAICMKAMSLRSESRHISPGALSEEIEHWLADEPVGAYAEPFRRRARRWAKRHRTAVTAFCASLMVGLVGLGIIASVQTKARNDLDRKNGDLVVANQALDEQRRRAEKNEAEAIAAVKRFGDVIASEPELKQIPALESLRKRLLNEPLAYFRALRERLLADHDTRAESLARLASACFELGDLTDEIGNKQEALIASREALAIRQRLAADNPAVTKYQSSLADSHNNIGLLLKDTGQMDEALKSYKTALAIRQKLASDIPAVTKFQSNLAASHNNIGIVLKDIGQPDEALKAYQAALAIRQKLATDNSAVTEFQRDLASSHNNIGVLLSDTGQPDGALEAYKSALAISQKLATDNPAVTKFQNSLANGYNNIGILLSDTGQPDGALKAYKAALAIRQKLADDNPSVTEFQSDLAASHNNIGVLLKETGLPDGALRAYQAALEIRQKLATDNSAVTEFQRDLASSHNNIGLLLKDTGQLSEALKAYQAALAIRQKLADDNPSVTKFQSSLANSLFMIGNLLGDTGKMDEALMSYKSALAIRQKLADDNPTVTDYKSELANSHNNIGIVLKSIGQPDRALEAHKAALVIRQKLATDNSAVTEFQRDLASSHNNIGVLLSDTGQPDGALEAYKAALAISQKLATDNPAVTKFQNSLANGHNNIGILLSDTGQPDGALKAYKAALAIRQKLADDNPSVTEFQSDLADSHFATGNLLNGVGQPDGALKAYQAALAIRQKLADDNPSVTEFQRELANCHNNIGTLLNKSGQLGEALKAYQEALAIRQKLADDNPAVTKFQGDLAASHNNIGTLLNGLGRSGEALKAYQAALAIRQKLASDNPVVTKFQSDLAASHNNIGILLKDIGQPDEALQSYNLSLAIRQKLADKNPFVIEFQSDLTSSHNNIGILLKSIGQPEEALKAYKAALAIRRKLAKDNPDSSDFSSRIGDTLHNIAVIDVNEKRFEAARELLLEAVVWQRKALAANPANPTYRQNLDTNLTTLIKVYRGLGNANAEGDALHELDEFRNSDPTIVTLDRRLIPVLKGLEHPKDDRQWRILAQRAQDKGLHAASTKLWHAAFEADPKAAESRHPPNRYNAARSACLAGCGLGKDDPTPDDLAKMMLREQALGWLQAEVRAWAKIVELGQPGAKAFVFQILVNWKEDPDLAGIRDEMPLGKLPESEQKAFRSLWADVEALRNSAKASLPTPTK